METKAVNFTKIFWNYVKLLTIGILLFTFVAASEEYDMERYCNQEFSFITKSKDQIKLELADNLIYDSIGDYTSNRKRYCQTTFEAWYTRYPKFMFYFEDLDLDCDKGHLEFYIGQNTGIRVSGLERDVCGKDKPRGVFTVEERYFRIKYVPKRSQYISDIFSIIITTYEDSSCPSYAYKCANSRCINQDLACNGYDSCGDGSGCFLSTAAIIGIVIGGLAGLALIISVVICCICATRRRRAATQGTVQTTGMPAVAYSTHNQQVYSQPMYGINQGSPYNPSQSPYPVATATNIATTASSQQGYSQPMYGVNQGTNYPTNQGYYPAVSSYSETK
ncbi:uncharacterized protein LOC128548493 [Mercenaria mercenaria]|uniref:uncharacterized protein LOC128548493 n=1 Tax=Mercenaria mercenaria TaxID=6596 RepID=UPI00234E781E|nr:uncharacterized protein LOC128548493 [Mercenaria mercenaria]